MKSKRSRLLWMGVMVAGFVAIAVVYFLRQDMKANSSQAESNLSQSSVKEFDIEIDPGTFTLLIRDNKGQTAYASRSYEQREVANFKEDGKIISWEYPNQGIQVRLKFIQDYLDVEIHSEKVGSFTWPVISEGVEAYTLPWHAGKFVPAQDPVWLEFCKENGYITGLQDLSMQFLGVNYSAFSLVYVINNEFDNEIRLDGDQSLGLTFTHDFPATVKEKNYGFRIYLRQNNPVDIAKTYRKFIFEQGRFVSLNEKAGDNPDIRKLFGAPHFYVWGDEFILVDHISKWMPFTKQFLEELDLPGQTLPKRILQISKEGEAGSELEDVLEELRGQDYVGAYQKRLIVAAINGALMSESLIPKTGERTKLESYSLNKQLFYDHFNAFMLPPGEWGNGTSNFVLDQLKEMGIHKAWLGLASFEPAYMHPEFLKRAVEEGYLMGTYDSYHSIHPPGNAGWETADFSFDPELYNRAAVKDKDGNYISGFQGRGRKLNPTLAMPAVQFRMDDLLSNGFAFNSWFIDCDATGETHDDYTEGRMTNKEDDLNARLKRMQWIRDEKGMVIGSEGGNDFAASTIAFAHGIVTPVFPWNDHDWRLNKESKYYFGRYYSPNGGVPIHFRKQVPIKDIYHQVYMSYKYNIPLYQLVYNNSVITSHQWLFGSLKMIDEVRATKLREVLFNVPPLYHIDRNLILENEKTISDHCNYWSRTHSRAIVLEMTSFEWVTEDRKVQKTQFEDKLEIIANFGENSFSDERGIIPAMSLMILDHENSTQEIYTPIQ